MEYRTKKQHLYVFTLSLLGFGMAIPDSYGQANDPKAVPVSAFKNKQDDGDDVEDRVGDNEEVKKKQAVYGQASFAIARNFNENHPAGTSFKPALLIDKKAEKPSTDDLAFSAELALGYEKFFAIAEKPSEIHAEVDIDQKQASLGNLYFKQGIGEESALYVGLKKNNFCNLAAGPSSAKALQLAWEIPFKPVEVGVSFEQAKELKLYPDKAKEEERKLKPAKALPAASVRVTYALPDKWGNIEASGIARPIEYFNPSIRAHKIDGVGFGLNLGGNVNVNRAVFLANLVYGRGVGDYMHDVCALKNEEHTAYVAGKNQVKLIDVIGTHANFKYKLMPSLSVNLKGGFNKVMQSDKEAKARKSVYNMGYYTGAGLNYLITDRIDFGADFTWGGKVDFSNTLVPDLGGGQIKLFSSFSFRKETEDEELQI